MFTGIRYLLKVTGAQKVIIAVEANKPDAADHLRETFPSDINGSVEVLQVKYPQGAEKMLISALLGREVPSRGLPLDIHALCCNVATTAEIGQLLPRRPRNSGTGHHGDGARGQAERQLPHPDRHARCASCSSTSASRTT